MPSSTSSSPGCAVFYFTSDYADSQLSDDCSSSDSEPLPLTNKRKRELENLQTISKRQFRGPASSRILNSGSPDGECRTKDSIGLSGGRLCSACSKINFDSIFESAKDITNRHGIMVAELGNRLDDMEVHTSGCNLCHLLYNSRFPWKATEYHLRAYSSLRSYRGLFFSNITKDIKKNDSVLLAVVPGKTVPLVDTSEIESHCWTKGYLCTTTPRKTVKCSLGHEVPRQVNYQLLDRWYQYCLRNHADCGRDESNSIPGLKVIDCEELTIGLASTSSGYVALSYVWGHTKAQPNSSISRLQHLSSHDKLATLPDYLPNVVTDAIAVTKGLGFRYLWVDRYCIDQGDAEEKHSLINKMDLIYSGAEITIIAAAGADEDFGLPGVGKTLRTAQPAVRVQGKLLLSSLGHPMHTINASKWSTRGWTYQEAVLSRRRLVFTEHQVYFECKVMNCHESHHHPLDFLHTKDKSRNRYFTRPGIFAGIDSTKDLEAIKHSRHIYSRFLTHIINFTSRSLTYESDALNAFSGIAHSFRSTKFSPISIRHLWGLPLEFPSLGSTGQIPKMSLINSLNWFHEVAQGAPVPRRRQGFPSWSWSGWEGKVVLEPLYDEDWRPVSGEAGYGSRFLTVDVELKNGGVISIQSCSANWLSEHEDQLAPFLHIKGRVLPPSASVPLLYSGGTHGGLLVSKAWNELEYIRRRLETEEWECMVLSRTKSITNLLVFEQRGDRAERVGMLCGESEVLRKGPVSFQRLRQRKIRFG